MVVFRIWMNDDQHPINIHLHVVLLLLRESKKIRYKHLKMVNAVAVLKCDVSADEITRLLENNISP